MNLNALVRMNQIKLIACIRRNNLNQRNQRKTLYDLIMSQPTIRKQKTFALRLTKFELIHLRDLFSIRLPPELKQTISQKLADVEERVMIEARLWQKLVASFVEAELPVDDDAPDFICSTSSVPSIGVFRLAHEPNQQPEESDGCNPFEVNEDDDSEEEDDVDEDEDT